jgi:acetoin utilization protein AcuB
MMMRVHEWMSHDPASIKPTAAAAEAGRVLQRDRIRHLPVVTGQRVVGMITDRDVRAAMPGATVQQAMSARLEVVNQAHSVEYAARLLLEHDLDALPVVDDHDQLMGLITITDCLRATFSTASSAGQPQRRNVDGA